jgi:hypothetical protein
VGSTEWNTEMSVLDALIARDSAAGPSALDSLISRDIGPTAAAATASQPQQGGLLQNIYQGLDTATQATPFTDALAHHAAKFFDQSALAVQKGLGSVGDYFDPNRQNPLNQQIHSDIAGDTAQLAQNEKAYQERVANSPTGSNIGAVAGEVLPWVLPTNLPAVGGKVAGLIGKALPESWMTPTVSTLANGATSSVPSALSTGIKRAAEGGIIGYGGSGGDSGSAGIGAGAAVALPPVLGAVGRSAGGFSDYLKSLYSPSSGAGAAIENFSSSASPSQSAITSAAATAPADVLSSATGIPQQNLANMPVADKADAAATAISQMTQPQKIAAALQLGGSPVPGVKYTAGQALAPFLGMDNAPIIQLEQGMRNSAKGAVAFAQRDAQNNSARMDYLNQFTKSQEEIKAMVADRRKLAEKAMGTVDSSGKYTPGDFSTPVDPAPVLSHIDNLMQTGLSTDPVIGKSLAAIKNQIASRTDPETGLVNPDMMDGIRQNINSIISDNASNGAVRSVQSAGLQPLANTITGSIEAANPGYRNYLSDYAKNSVPINTAEAANGLLSGDTGKLVSGGKNIASETELTIPKLTSAINSINGLEHGVSPEFSQALSNVHQDLQNASVSNAKLGAVGSPTQYYGNLSGQIGDAIKGNMGLFEHPLAKALTGGAAALAGHLTGLPGAEMGSGTLSLLGMKGASSLGGQRLQQGYIDMLLNPDKLSSHLSQSETPEISSLGEYLKNLPIIGK